tara:strand:- start:89370 stop:90536 length:1167 start_codon:yes stop_codon:yes gene_type:complete
MSDFQFTSESVSPGHPDKLCDQLSDTILDYALADDKKSKVACEVLAKGEHNKSGWLVIAGEITSNSNLDFENQIREAICNIGYDSDELGFNGKTCIIHKMINQQSPDIKMGVDKDDEDKQGAGDQGLMFGYATDETEVLMPAPIFYSHRLVEKQTEIFKNKTTPWLRPDAKSQVTFLYENNKPKHIDTVVLSTQHSKDLSLNQIKEFITEEVIYKVIPREYLTNQTKILVNPTGNFVIGGPLGDCGLTGRKIIVDTYGGMARHGGGAFSGKDPSKVDRSAAYLCRYIAKNIVAAHIAKKCEIQISYAIGVDEPTSISINTFGTGKVDDLKLVKIIKDIFEVRPSKIIKSLDLLNKKYVPTSAFGHFGRTDSNFSWEETNKIDILKESI